MSRPRLRPAARPRYPKPDRRRALKLLAASSNGRTEASMIAHGITTEMMVEMIAAGLATASAERVVAGGKTIEIARVKITDAGRRTLAAAER